jgi:antitoxin (DNA-binding transcriptional repressor) of toxin-antitoxin stability system
MLRISVEEATDNFKVLLAQVAQGEEIILVEQEQAVARLVPVQSREQWLASAKVFRTSLSVEGQALSETVIQEREEDRS